LKSGTGVEKIAGFSPYRYFLLRWLPLFLHHRPNNVMLNARLLRGNRRNAGHNHR
jgi:hypothetical protein